MSLTEEIDMAIGGYEEGSWVPESDEVIKLVGLLSRAKKELAAQQSVQRTGAWVCSNCTVEQADSDECAFCGEDRPRR